MPQSFECPKCGAPLNYNAADQNYAETINCPYCNNSIIVPEQLRVRPPQVVHSRYEVIDRTPQPYYQSGAPVVNEVGRRSGGIIGGCIAAVVAMVVIFGIAIALFTARLGQSTLDIVNQVVPLITEAAPPTRAPVPTSFTNDVETQVAPLLETATAAAGILSQLLTPTAVPATEAPTIDLAATADAEAALNAALGAKLAEQRTWPITLNENFDNANRNWNVGSSNGALSVEDFEITGNQYIWKITSKKSMGTFSFPDMDSQTDIYISVKMSMTNSTGNFSDQAGIIFRQSNGAFYFFGANPQGSYSLRLYDGSGWQVLIPLSESQTLTDRKVNLLEVSAEGSQIILAVNEVIIGSIEDNYLDSGVAGLGVNLPAPGEDATVIFSDFVVRAP